MTVMEGKNNEFNPEIAAVPEYAFDAGVAEITGKIKEILERQAHAVVAFCASGNHVGKTALARALVSELAKIGVSAKTFHDTSQVAPKDIQERIVFIFDEMEWDSSDASRHIMIREHHDSSIETAFKGVGSEVKKIDLWVGICRPDKPFFSGSAEGEKNAPIADIIIRNEKAKDKTPM
jgi:hypothetical protein